MPKMKTHSATKKRFTRVGNGSKVKRGKAGKRHLLTGKSRKTKRNIKEAEEDIRKGRIHRWEDIKKELKINVRDHPF